MELTYTANIPIELSGEEILAKELLEKREEFLKKVDADIKMFDEKIKGHNKRRIILTVLGGFAVIANAVTFIIFPLTFMSYVSLIAMVVMIFLLIKIHISFRRMNNHFEEMKNIRRKIDDYEKSTQVLVMG